MKRLLLLTTLIGFSFISFSQTKSTNYPESGFSINFPKEPAIQKQSVDSKIGKIDMIVYVCDSESYVIMISESKFQKELTSKLDKTGTERFLEGSRDGGLKKLASEMEAELKITSDEKYLFNNKYQALKTIGKLNDLDFTSVSVMKNNQMYQIIAMGDTSSKEITASLNSFSIID